MKFTVAALLAAFTTASFAQNVHIGSPANNTSVSPGSSIVVEVDRPNFMSSTIEVALVIAIKSCGTAGCLAPGFDLGSILYNGPYDPQLQSPTSPNPPFQNFTVTIPPTIAQGLAQLTVFHVALIGAGPETFTETLAINLDVD